MALVSYLIGRPSSRPATGWTMSSRSTTNEFLATMAGATGVPFLAGQPHRHPEQRRRASTRRCSRRSNGRTCRSRSRPTSTGRARSASCSRTRWRRKRKAGVTVKILLDAVGSATHRRRDPDDARERSLSGGLVQPDPLVHVRPLQPPHPPEVADHRRPRGVHRRRGDRRPLARQRRGSRSLARHADPARRAGGHAAADRLRAELAADHVAS